MTIAMLFRNTLVAARRRAGLRYPEGLYDARLCCSAAATADCRRCRTRFRRATHSGIGQWTAFRKYADQTR